jgi:hypothetical protein
MLLLNTIPCSWFAREGVTVVVSALYPGPWVLPSVHWLKGTSNQAFPLYSTHHSSEAAKKVVVSALYPRPWVLPSVHWLKGTDNQAFPYTALTIVLELQRNFALAMRRFTLGSFATKFGWFMACYIPTTSQKKEKRKKSSLSLDLVLLVTNWRELAHCHN